MPIYVCSDGNGVIEIEADSGEAAAHDYVDGGEWGYNNKTFWINVRVTEKGTNDTEFHKIEVAPEEPECDDGNDHHWREISMRGNAGGVITTSRCVHCGKEVTVNTWDYDPQDGQQALVSVEYGVASC